MAIVALWEFGAGGLRLGAVADASYGLDAPQVYPDGDGRLDADSFTLDNGSLRVGFRQLLQMGTGEDVILTFDQGGTRLQLGVTEDGAVRLHHHTADERELFATPDEFFRAGDSVLVTHCWDFGGEAGFCRFDNLTTGASHALEVPGSLTLDEDALDPAAWTLGPDEGSAPDSMAFAGRLTHLSLHDDSDEPPDEQAEPEGPALSLWDEGEDHTADIGADRPDAGAGNETPVASLQQAGDFTVTVTFEGGSGGAGHSLGIYSVDPLTDEIIDAVLLWEDTRPESDGGSLEPGSDSASFTVPAGARIGAFLIVDGNAVNDFAALGDGELMFLDEDGNPATPESIMPRLFHQAPDGSLTAISGDILHSAGPGDGPGLNPDGALHLRGLGENDGASWTFGFAADPYGAGDGEFGDVVFTVDLGLSGASFFNPDFETSPLPEEGDADSVAILFGGDDFDALILQDAARIGEIGTSGAHDHTDDAAGVSGTDARDDHVLEMHLASVEKIVPCFTPGTMIDTSGGPVPVEHLRPGDRVLTRDNGFQPLQWVGCKALDAAELVRQPEFRPVRIARDSFGRGLPDRDLCVSPQHRILLAGPEAELLFGEHEVLVPALHLVGLPGVARDDSRSVTYVHVMCRQHEILRGDGVWSESFQPGDMSLAGLDAPQRNEILRLFPQLASRHGRAAYRSARLTLRAHEARALLLAEQPRSAAG